ncbi:MAG: TCR/Tet family MFS transporter [Planctomycetia bacterium]|nr:TCR/Tet family MFS transporter [Planctomycetia bacterium]
MPPRAAGQQAILFIWFTVLIDTIGFGIVLPVLPELIMELTGVEVSEAATYGGFLATTFAVAQFVFGPVIGNLSDRFGRRPVLLAALLAFGLDYILMGVAPNLTWLFIGRLIAGITGAAVTPANAFVADVSPPDKRAQNFGLMGAAFGLGFILGPAVGGLLGHFGTRAPFFAAAACALLNVAYGWFVLPESLPPESRRPFSWRRASLLGTWSHLSRYPVVAGLIGVLFLWQLAHQSLPNIWAYFTEYRFGWSEAAVGWSLAYAGLTMMAVQAGLTRVLVPRFGERRATFWGLVIGALGFLGYAWSTHGWMMYLWITIAAPSGVVFPSIRGIMSQQIPADAQGELQGGIASLYSLTSIIGPVMMTQLFSRFTAETAPVQFAGAAFLFAAVLTTASIALFLRTGRSAAQGLGIGD